MEFDLFGWWMASISSSIVFLTLVSIYIYATRKGKTCEPEEKNQAKKIAINFAFVWVLIGLLIFYIASVQIGSSLLFAAGNIAVEAMLIIYLFKNKTKTESCENNQA